MFFYVARFFADQFDGFIIYHLGHNFQRILVYAEIIRCNCALYDVFAQAPGTFNGNRRIITRYQVNRKHNAGSLGEDHHLDSCTQCYREVIKALFRTIVGSTICKSRSIAFFYLFDDHVCAFNVQIGILLAGKAGIRQIFGCGTGTNGHKGIAFAHFLAQFFIAGTDGISQIFRHFRIANRLADGSCNIAQLCGIFDVRQAF